MRPLLILAGIAGGSLVAQGAEWHAGPGQALRSVKAAISAAAPGDTVVVHEGVYQEGALRIDRPLTLAGVGNAVLDGGSTDEIILITASDVTVRGVTLRNGGRSSTRELAGIRVESARGVTLAGNRFSDCNYAIYLAKARDCEVRDNCIEGRAEREINSGNGVHLWNCRGVRVRGNRITGHRDGIYLEFASDALVENNVVEDNLRYGLHFMSSHGSRYDGNHFRRNGAGVAVMYSRQVEMTNNVFESNWGGSAYGLLIKDLTDSRITGNVFRRNSTAIYAQGATRMMFERQRVSAKTGGRCGSFRMETTTPFRRTTSRGNSFDVGTNGDLEPAPLPAQLLGPIRRLRSGSRRNGRRAVPAGQPLRHRRRTRSSSVLLIRSFMVHLLDRAEKAFPSITPESVLDETPSMRPHDLKFPQATSRNPNPTQS